MALVFGDSFDHYATADLLKKWTSTNMSTAEMTTAPLVYMDAQYALAPHGSGMLLGNDRYIEKALTTPLTTFWIGFWFRTNQTSSAKPIITCMDSATPGNIHVSLRHDSTGHITFCRDSTVLATSANTLALNTWYHIEFKAIIGDVGDSPSGRYEVRVDGTATNWIPDSGTGKDTRNAGDATIGSVRLYGGVNVGSYPATTGHMFQDFYLLNATGAVASDFLGPSRFQVSRPVAVGTTAEWTGNYADNWQNVADGRGDSDTTFNQSSTAGQTDQFAMTDVPAGTIHAIQHVIMARRDTGGARTIRPVTRIGTTDYNGTTVTAAAAYAFHCEAVSVSPATSSAWTDTEVNGAEFGYELVS